MTNLKGNLEIVVGILHVYLPRMFTIDNAFSVSWFLICFDVRCKCCISLLC